MEGGTQGTQGMQKKVVLIGRRGKGIPTITQGVVLSHIEACPDCDVSELLITCCDACGLRLVSTRRTTFMQQGDIHRHKAPPKG